MAHVHQPPLSHAVIRTPAKANRPDASPLPRSLVLAWALSAESLREAFSGGFAALRRKGRDEHVRLRLRRALAQFTPVLVAFALWEARALSCPRQE